MTNPCSNTLEDVTQIIMTQLAIPKEKISIDADFSSDLGFDSLEQVEFIMALEEKFGLTISDEEATEIKTVRQAVEKIEGAVQ